MKSDSYSSEPVLNVSGEPFVIYQQNVLDVESKTAELILQIVQDADKGFDSTQPVPS